VKDAPSFSALWRDRVAEADERELFAMILDLGGAVLGLYSAMQAMTKKFSSEDMRDIERNLEYANQNFIDLMKMARAYTGQDET
jgi:hypothetical protein